MSVERDPICGMPGTIERHGHRFCGTSCIAEFERRRGNPPVVWRRWFDPWVWVPVSGVAFVLAGERWSALASARAIYLAYLTMVAGPLAIGLLLGGLIDRFVPRESVIALLTGHRKRVIARSTLLGFLASSCSHGCLALAMELYRKGASVPAVVSFLLASPWASMSFTLMLLGFFGARGLLIIGGALGIAFVTGLIFQRLARRGLIEANPLTIVASAIAPSTPRQWTVQQLGADLVGVAQGIVPLGRMILGWVQVGLLAGALIGAFVPPHVFHRFFGPSLGGLLATLLAATVTEVCSEGSAPLAFELFRQTGALGNAFVFLMAGVITDYAELGAVWTNIGRRTVGWLLAVTLPLVLLLGWRLNVWSR